MQRLVLKSLALALGALLIVSARAEAQRPLFVFAGPTFATITGDDAEALDFESKTGFLVGIGTSMMLNETFAIEPALVYVQKGGTSSDEDLSLDYLEIPVLLTATFPITETMALNLGAGPQFSFNLSCEAGDEDCSDSDGFNSTDFGIVGTAGINFPLNDRLGLAIGAGADLGLSEVFDDFDAKTRTYFLYVGLGIPIGG